MCNLYKESAPEVGERSAKFESYSLNSFIMLFEECILLPIWKHIVHFSFYFIMLHFKDFLGVPIFH